MNLLVVWHANQFTAMQHNFSVGNEVVIILLFFGVFVSFIFAIPANIA